MIGVPRTAPAVAGWLALLLLLLTILQKEAHVVPWSVFLPIVAERGRAGDVAGARSRCGRTGASHWPDASSPACCWAPRFRRSPESGR